MGSMISQNITPKMEDVLTLCALLFDQRLSKAHYGNISLQCVQIMTFQF